MSFKEYIEFLVRYVKNPRNDGFSQAGKVEELREKKARINDRELKKKVENTLASVNV